MRNYIVTLLLLFPLFINAQGEAANWYFGINAGLQFDINTGVPTPLTNGQLVTNEGCSSISDPAGNLLFYTDGITVYDASHNIMPNGTGLHGNPTSTQSAIIVPLPGDNTQYFIFTVGFPDGGPDLGLKYSRVDLTLNGGLGDVVPGQKNIQLLADCSEKVTAVSHASNAEFWVIAYGNINQTGNNFNTFFVYNISSAGVNMTPITSTFTNAASDRRGYLKLSVDGQKMASANATNGLFLYDFN
ncbi:MAG: hypothetical protein RQ756_08090, partial [Flavobacteriaceae bacterium]|nr:hypothetical protein [Flavobacteriaceae bacterium]